VIRIEGNGTHRTASDQAISDARNRFEQDGCLSLPTLIDPALLPQLIEAIDQSPFYDREHHGIGLEQCLSPGTVTTALELLSNDPSLLDLMAQLTGCGPFGCFDGRVYRLAPGTSDHDSWHNDVGRDRRVAMSVNLGREPFQGGALQIQRIGQPESSREMTIAQPGDAIIFRIDMAYRHRVAPLEGTVPRTAFAGWFCATPDFQTLFDSRSRQQSQTL
jgi:hypothetical protein